MAVPSVRSCERKCAEGYMYIAVVYSQAAGQDSEGHNGGSGRKNRQIRTALELTFALLPAHHHTRSILKRWYSTVGFIVLLARLQSCQVEGQVPEHTTSARTALATQKKSCLHLTDAILR